jgi:EAL domain-containing protein (putative c-di-GMP-specific phosphodiesterase class I)
MSAAESMSAADAAMYDAKHHGRNRVAISCQATKEAMRAELGWLERLRGALAEHRFELHAQPITDLRTGEVHCLELLLRVREQDGRLLMPTAFIPAAERVGVNDDIDRWVLREAIRLASQDRHSNLRYGLNLSGASRSAA